MSNLAQPTDENWIEDYLEPNHPELVAPYQRAMEIGRSAIASGNLAESDLALLIDYAKDPRMALSENVATILGELAAKFSGARDAIRSLAREKKAIARVNSIVALGALPVSDIHYELLAEMLLDRSAKVVTLASDNILTFGLRRLLPELESAIERVQKPKMRATLEWQRDLLRDGYRIRDEGGQQIVTCRKDGGVISKVFSPAEMETFGRAWIATNMVPAKG